MWQHQGQEGAWFSVTIARSYTDDKGEWHASNSYGMDDLLVVAELARQAWGWVSEEIARLRQEDGGNGNGNGRPPHNPDADDC